MQIYWESFANLGSGSGSQRGKNGDMRSLDLSHKYNLSITPWRCVDHGLAASATQAAWHNRNKKQLAGEFNNKDWCDWEGQYVTVVSVLFIKLEKQKKHHSPYVFRSFWLDCTIGLHPYMWGTNWLFCFHLNSNKLCFFFFASLRRRNANWAHFH